MENVPVKLVVPYVPPTSIYKLPSFVCKKIAQARNYYNESAEFNYSFSFEREILAKWHSFRQTTHREEQERMAFIARYQEEQQAKEKALLGAVSYPSTEDLSSETCSLSGKEEDDELTPPNNNAGTSYSKDVPNNSFNNILQPTVLSGQRTDVKRLKETVLLANTNSSINYADFEYNSSPFDNIELKSINDLDVLAQVLYNVKIETSKTAQKDDAKAENMPAGTDQQADETIGKTDNAYMDERNDNEGYDFLLDAECFRSIRETKAQLERINFDVEDFNNIPNCLNSMPQSYSSQSYGTQESTSLMHSAYQPKLHNVESGASSREEEATNWQFHNNQFPNKNSLPSTNTTNSNRACAFMTTTPTRGGNKQSTEDISDNSTKSSMLEGVFGKTSAIEKDSFIGCDSRHQRSMQSAKYSVSSENQPSNAIAGSGMHQAVTNYNELDLSNQKLAQQISVMGFPLERVAKAISVCGPDDKKIIEHLLILSELIDLGFEESKITIALAKFDNNKEKAIDFLIS